MIWLTQEYIKNQANLLPAANTASHSGGSSSRPPAGTQILPAAACERRVACRGSKERAASKQVGESCPLERDRLLVALRSV